MIRELVPIVDDIRSLVSEWETRLSALDTQTASVKLNGQRRSVRQITGHMVDSASNNLHRIVHLQYGADPLSFPNYSTDGNNDRWIAIQNFQGEDWEALVMLWKYSNLHIAHVIENIDPGKLEARWIAAPGVEITLRKMAEDYPPHMRLHLGEIEELMSD